jgi:uncharacterized protein (DUF342 family)
LAEIEKAEKPKYRTQMLNGGKDIVIGITPDNMGAYLSIKPGLRKFQSQEVFSLLESENIFYGIDRDKINALIERVNTDAVAIHDELIVKGTHSVPGRDAYIKYHFNATGELKLIEDEEGNIDYRELGLLNNVTAGQLLAEKIPMQEPVNGTDIYGNPVVPPPARDTRIIIGKNVKLIEEGTKCVSEIEGQVFLKNKIINASELYQVPHDVDMHVGNLNFNGSIIVNGDILSGFTVKAKGDITVLGVIEAATVIAGGNVFIKRGFKGGEKGFIQCGGDITARFIDGGRVECGTNMILETNIADSDVTCFGKITLNRQKGTIVGGTVRAVKGIDCIELGSKMGVNTTVMAGDKFRIKQLQLETELEIAGIGDELTKIAEEAAKLKDILGKVAPLLQQLDKLAEDKRTQIMGMVEKQRELKAKPEELNAKLKELEAKRNKLVQLWGVNCLSTIKVKKIAHPGSLIVIGHSKLLVKEPFSFCTFHEEHHSGSIGFGPY